MQPGAAGARRRTLCRREPRAASRARSELRHAAHRNCQTGVARAGGTAAPRGLAGARRLTASGADQHSPRAAAKNKFARMCAA